MKNSLKYFIYSAIFCIVFSLNANGQSRNTASIDIRIRIVNSLSSTLVQNGVLGKVDSKTYLSKTQNRELLVEFNNRAKTEKKVKNEVEFRKLTVFDRNNEKIGQTDLNDALLLKNVSMSEKLQFVPAARTKTEEENSFEPSITIVY